MSLDNPSDMTQHWCLALSCIWQFRNLGTMITVSMVLVVVVVLFMVAGAMLAAVVLSMVPQYFVVCSELKSKHISRRDIALKKFGIFSFMGLVGFH